MTILLFVRYVWHLPMSHAQAVLTTLKDHLEPLLEQLESRPKGYTAHSVSIYRGRIYDAAELRSMPFEDAYMDRCVREDKFDPDTFFRFKKVLLLSPSQFLKNALRRKRKHVAA